MPAALIYLARDLSSLCQPTKPLNRKPTGRSYQYYLYVHRYRLTSFIQTINPLVTGITAKLHNKIKHPFAALGKQIAEKFS